MMRQTVLAIALACTIGAAAAQGAARRCRPQRPDRRPTGSADPCRRHAGERERYCRALHAQPQRRRRRSVAARRYPGRVSAASVLRREGCGACRRQRGCAGLPPGQSAGAAKFDPLRPQRPRGGRSSAHLRPTAAADPGSADPLQADGKIQRLVYGPAGEVNGALVSDGTVVRMPPHLALQFADLLGVGAPLSASGFGVATRTVARWRPPSWAVTAPRCVRCFPRRVRTARCRRPAGRSRPAGRWLSRTTRVLFVGFLRWPRPRGQRLDRHGRSFRSNTMHWVDPDFLPPPAAPWRVSCSIPRPISMACCSPTAPKCTRRRICRLRC